MAIKKVKIKNFKCFEGEFCIHFNEKMNIIVGNNEAGKSTILEAINLALTGYYRGKSIRNELSQYLFNKNVIDNYLQAINNGEVAILPEISIEVYMSTNNNPEFMGNGNTDNCKETEGIIFKILFDDRYVMEYNTMIKQGLQSLPIEYYDVCWMSFARERITPRAIPLKSSMIDSSNYRYANGSDVYISRIVKNLLEDNEITGISKAHRLMKESFLNDESILDINKRLTESVELKDRELSISVNLGTKNSWQNSLITEVDKIPYDNIGKGMQCILKTQLALNDVRSKNNSVVLLEEPECHLSFSSLNIFLSSLLTNYENKQIILSTHSSFVANKLGLENLLLLNDSNVIRINEISDNTINFFKKIKGYDTLRLILSKKAILVEGDSDELIVQRAYMDNHRGKLPIEDGIDVISVGTSFSRFLEIAEKVNIPVNIITDNDGNIDAIIKKYNKYLNNDEFKNIKIFYDEIEYPYEGELDKYNCNTLEPCILRANSLQKINKILGKNFKTEDKLLNHMYNNKTDCALAFFETSEEIKFPKYIIEAITHD